MYNKTIKVFILFFIFLTSILSLYSIGFYEGGEYVYHTNNNNFNIEYEIKFNPNVLYVGKVYLKVNSENTYNHTINETLNFFENKKYSFKLSDFSNSIVLTKDTNLRFEIELKKNESRNEDIKLNSNGIPRKFRIKLEDKTIETKIVNKKSIFLNGVTGTNEIEFSKKIQYLKIGDIEIFSAKNSKNNYDYKKKIEFSNTIFKNIKEGEEKKYTLNYKDVYDNEKTEELIVYNSGGGKLTIDLITRKEDSSLNYYFEKNKDIRKTFFLNNIWVKDSNGPNIKIKTNKKSTCYFASLDNFQTEGRITTNEKIFFDSVDFLTHTKNIPFSKKKLYIYCKDKYKEIGSPVSLNKILLASESDPFINSLYTKPLEKISLFPSNGFVTSTPYKIELLLNEIAYCRYKFGSGTYSPLSASSTEEKNFKSNEKNDIDKTNRDLNIYCYDKVFNELKVNVKYVVDISGGFRVAPVTFYSESSTKIINLKPSSKLKDSESCYLYNLPQNTVAPANKIDDLTKITISSLVEGTNIKYIICKIGSVGQTNLFTTQLSVIYDKNGPIINEVVLKNGNTDVKYLNSLKNLNVEITNISNIIDVEKYNVTLIGKSSKQIFNKTFLNKNIKINSLNLTNLTKVQIIPINKIGQVGKKYDLSIVFDLEKPEFEVKDISSGLLNIEAKDNKELKKIRYGFSASATCAEIYIYNSSSEIKINHDYVCIKAIDFAGNFLRKVVDIKTGNVKVIQDDSGLTIEDDEILLGEEEVYSGVLNESDKKYESKEEVILVKKKGIGLGVILFILFLVLVLVLIGGLFGLREYGYLDEYIKKYSKQFPLLKKYEQILLKNKSIKEEIKTHNKTISNTKLDASKIFENKKKSENKIAKVFESLSGIFSKRVSEENKLFNKFEKTSKKLKVKGIEEEGKSFEEFFKKKSKK